jgi:hypothetical protein
MRQKLQDHIILIQAIYILKANRHRRSEEPLGCGKANASTQRQPNRGAVHTAIAAISFDTVVHIGPDAYSRRVARFCAHYIRGCISKPLINHKRNQLCSKSFSFDETLWPTANDLFDVQAHTLS